MSNPTVEAIIKKFSVRTRDNLPFVPRKCDRIGLAEFFGEFGLDRGVEVGTKRGDYAKIMCGYNPNIDLTCVDPWCGFGKHLTQEMQDRNYSIAVDKLKEHNVKFIKKFSMDALSDFPDRSLDFAYIDGAHDFDNAAIDIIFWSKKVREGGIVAVHDYFHFFRSGVVQAVDGYVHCNMITPWFVTREALPTAFWVNP
jgi:hypothetical protein